LRELLRKQNIKNNKTRIRYLAIWS